MRRNRNLHVPHCPSSVIPFSIHCLCPCRRCFNMLPVLVSAMVLVAAACAVLPGPNAAALVCCCFFSFVHLNFSQDMLPLPSDFHSMFAHLCNNRVRIWRAFEWLTVVRVIWNKLQPGIKSLLEAVKHLFGFLLGVCSGCLSEFKRH